MKEEVERARRAGGEEGGNIVRKEKGRKKKNEN